MRSAYCDKAQTNHGITNRFCRKLHTKVSELKEQLIARYEASAGSSNRVREALSTAESQAWETSFPHLFFPDLAEVHLAAVFEEEPIPFSLRA